MAVLLTKKPNNLTEYPNAFKRQGAYPLEADSIYQTLADAQKYAKEDPIAYVTQLLAVAAGDGTVVYYVIADEEGNLFKLGSSEMDLDELDRRLDEIEKFFAKLDGESFDQALDTLIEAQERINLVYDNKDENGNDKEPTGLLVDEINRATTAEEELDSLIKAETERANKADDELYAAIEALTEEDIHLKQDLWTYANIGKITGASDTSRKKVADKGASLKDVFDAILGTRQDTLPTITNNASLTATEGTLTYASNSEFGTTVVEKDITITFTLANTGKTNYGYKVGETTYNGQQTFYYPIIKQENADLKITLPSGKAIKQVSTGTLVKTDNNVVYCNFSNKVVSIVITLPADTVETSEQTRFGQISAAVSLGAPQDANGNNITKFLTFLENEGESAKVEAPAPADKKGGDKSDTAGPYKIGAGYVPYTYCLSEGTPGDLPTTNRSKALPSSITVSGGNDNTYLYIFVPTGKGDITSMSASGFSVPFKKIETSKSYAVNNGKTNTYKIFKTEGSVKADTFSIK